MSKKEFVKSFVRTKKFAVIVSSLISAAGASAATVAITFTRLEAKFAAISEQEIAEAKAFYQAKFKEESDPTTLAEQYADDELEEIEDEEETVDIEMVKTSIKILREKQYVSYDKPEQVKEEEVIEVKASIASNVFDNPVEVDIDEDDGFDLDEELKKKDAGKPYIIEKDEFFHNEGERIQSTLTWFDGDKVLADEQDRPVNTVAKVIGDDNLHFGRGSGDPKVVYIRNERFNAEYEVTYSNGKYKEEVLGYIEHSDRVGLRRFRDTD